MSAGRAAASLSAGSISLAAAHGITPRVTATWSPGLLRTARLLVPVELDVLMVRDAGLPWAQTAMTPPQKGGSAPVSAATLAAPLFTALPGGRQPGAYLQWYLPNWFTAGTATAPAQSSSASGAGSGTGSDGSSSGNGSGSTGTGNGSTAGNGSTVTFPQVPDRWLVLRLYSTAASPLRQLRGWVLEAGSGAPPQPAALDGWTEAGPATDVVNPLTALGHGDTAWLGYFDNVVNRFGFADTYLTSDKVTGSVAYLVCGWFADPAADPLGNANVSSLTGFDARMAELGWVLDASQVSQLGQVTGNASRYVNAAASAGLQVGRIPAQQAWWPAGCLLHGAAVDLGWPQPAGSGAVGGPPDPGSVQLAVGSTMAEAMGALIAAGASNPGLAPLVEGLELGIYREVDQPDGRAQFDLASHAASFSSLALDPSTTEPLDIAPSGPPPAEPASPGPPGQGIFGYPPVSTGGSAAPPPPPAAVTTTHEATVPEPTRLGVIASAPGLGDHPIEGHLGGTLTLLGAGVTAPASDPGGTVTASRPAPRFYLPKDPVVLVAGAARSFSHDSSVQTSDGSLVCRLATVTELSWAGEDLATRAGVSGQDALVRGVENGSVPVECEALLAETALLDPGSGPAIAAAYAASGQSAGGASAQSAALQNITAEQTAWWSLRDPQADHAGVLARSGFAGTLPAPFSVSPPAGPWTPLHLEWQASFLPSPATPNDTDEAGDVAGWALGEIDYDLAGKNGQPAGDAVPLSGRAPLTGGAAQALSTAVSNAISQAARIAAAGTVPAGTVAHNSKLAMQTSGGYQGITWGKNPSGGTGTGAGGGPGTGSGSAGGTGTGTGSEGGTGAGNGDSGGLTDIATTIATMDVLSGGLNGVLLQLRGGIAPDGSTGVTGGTLPSPFFGLRAGSLSLRRLRLVDGFGQFLDLLTQDGALTAGGLLISAAAAVPQPGVIGLPPRFTAPARATFRWMSASWTGTAAAPLPEATYQVSPLCGFLLPNHLEGSLEFFNADGSGAGSLVPRPDGRDAWQDAPGVPSAAGQSPARALASPFTAAIAQGIIDWGLSGAGRDPESALSALLRTIDSTVWSTDPFGHQGDEHLSLLVGHPVCVLRAVLRLDVRDPVPTPDATVTAVSVRLGCLAHWQDGVLGYFVNDDYSTLYAADAAAAGMARPFGPGQGFLGPITSVPAYNAAFASDLAATGTTTGGTPVTHPYLNTGGVITVRPGQVVPLTLLVEPLTSVYLTTGLTPRKQIGMRRTWVSDGLAAIAPTFRFGPVLTGPKQVRMPLATDLAGAWLWDARADAVSWTESPASNATGDALLDPDPPVASEGWLKLSPPPPGGTTSGAGT